MEKASAVVAKMQSGVVKNRDLQSIVGLITANAPTQRIIDELAPVGEHIIYGKDKGEVDTLITEENLVVLRQVNAKCSNPFEM